MNSSDLDLDREASKIRSEVVLSKGRRGGSTTRQYALKSVRDLQGRVSWLRRDGSEVAEPIDHPLLQPVFAIIGEAKVAGHMVGYSDQTKALMVGFRSQWNKLGSNQLGLFQYCCRQVGIIEFVQRERELSGGDFNVHPLVDREAHAHYELGRMAKLNPELVVAGKAAIEAMIEDPEGARPDEGFWLDRRADFQFAKEFSVEVVTRAF